MRTVALAIADDKQARCPLVWRRDVNDNERCLALRRICKAEEANFTFERPKGFNLEQFDNYGRFGYGDDSKVKLSFRIEKVAALHVVKCPLSPNQVLVELADGYEIADSVVDSDMLE